MRILYFHQYFSTREGSSGTRSYEMARRAVERGHQVLVVCGSAARGHTGLTGPFRRGRRRGQVDGIDIIEFDLGYSNSQGFLRRVGLFVLFALRSTVLALGERYDLVFATTTPLTAGVPGVVARWLRRKRFVFEVRDLWPELPRAMGVIKNPLVLAAMSALEWVSYRSAHRLIGLAPGIVAGIAARGVDPRRIAFIPNGCDVDLFDQPVSPSRPPDVPADSLLAVFAGAHGLANGLDAVLDAAAELERAGREDITIVLVGDGMLKPRLRQRARAMGLRNVVFLDPIPKGQLARLMAATNVGLQILADVPAFYEGTSPNKFFDYLSAGLPVLINYPGWLAKVVEETGCGFAVPPGDARAFAGVLIRAADARDSLRAMGAESRRLARERFDRKALADQFVDCLEETAR